MPGVPEPEGFVRPDPAPGSPLPTLAKSNVVVLNDGTSGSFPTREDYVARYVAQGLVKDEEDLLQNRPELIAEIFANWIATGQLGCLFASFLARSPRENRWLPISYVDDLDPSLPDYLNSQLDAALQTHEAAFVLFPRLKTDVDVVDLVNALCADPSGRWYRTDDGIGQATDCALVGLRWILGTDKSVNYVLGFASIATMALTRHAPFTALFLRINEVKRTPPEHEDGRSKVHLADLDSKFNPQTKHDKVAELTKVKRANHVEPQKTATARARVTFAVSPSAAERLCASRNVTLT